jgi:site-specific DNA recombinase
MTKRTVQTVKAGLLARVSTDRQENNSSLDAQLRRDREHCQKKNYTVVVERKEVFSGGFVLARSVLNELLTMMANGQINCIVVDITDRLGRGEVIAQCELLAKLNGGWIEYAQSGRDTSTVEGIALHATDQLVSGIERINIKRRTTGGKYAWAQKGRVITSSMRPYGYDFVIKYDDRGHRVDATLCIVEDEARVVVMIYEWIVYEGLTIRGIATRLTDMGIPKYTQKGLPHRKANRRAEWSRQTIAQLLRNTLYKGEWRFGKLKVERIDTPDGIRRKIARRCEDETVAVQVPAIVSADLWDAAQAQLEENHRKFKRPTKNVYPLRGRIRCALCGGMMVGHCPREDYRYYICHRHISDYAGSQDHCPAKYVPARGIEETVWNEVRQALLDPDRLLIGARKHREEMQASAKLLEQAMMALEAQVSQSQAKIDRLLDLHLSGNISQDQYVSKKSELEGAIKRLRDEQDRVRERMQEQQYIPEETENAIRHFAAEIAERLNEEWPDSEKMTLYDLLRLECVYNYTTGELVISGLLSVMSRYPATSRAAAS